MLDTITYVKTEGGTVLKTVVREVTVKELEMDREAEALEAQLADFRQSQKEEHSDEVAAAIVNYEKAIAELAIARAK